jgi:hypothetical protein
MDEIIHNLEVNLKSLRIARDDNDTEGFLITLNDVKEFINNLEDIAELSR